MNPEQLLALVGEHRDSIRESLDDEQYALFLARLGALAETAEEDNKAVLRALKGVKHALIPLPFDHPVYLALDSPGSPGPRRSRRTPWPVRGRSSYGSRSRSPCPTRRRSSARYRPGCGRNPHSTTRLWTPVAIPRASEHHHRN